MSDTEYSQYSPKPPNTPTYTPGDNSLLQRLQQRTPSAKKPRLNIRRIAPQNITSHQDHRGKDHVPFDNIPDEGRGRQTMKDDGKPEPEINEAPIFTEAPDGHRFRYGLKMVRTSLSGGGLKASDHHIDFRHFESKFKNASNLESNDLIFNLDKIPAVVSNPIGLRTFQTGLIAALQYGREVEHSLRTALRNLQAEQLDNAKLREDCQQALEETVTLKTLNTKL
jgi:hypothetical protein